MPNNEDSFRFPPNFRRNVYTIIKVLLDAIHISVWPIAAWLFSDACAEPSISHVKMFKLLYVCFA